jgi:hypothetical protein
MRKDSAFILGFSVLITAGIVGGAYYMNEVRPLQDAASRTGQQEIPVTEQVIGDAPSLVYPQNNPTDQIIKCFDPEKGEFWTNAKDCESADLSNRISNAQTYKSIDYISPSAKEVRRNLRASANRKSSGKPSLRQVGNTVPDGLSVSCKFAVGRAQEIERSLSVADDPAESIWRENYCRWVKDARNRGCRLERDVFYYGYLCGHGLRTAN